MIFSELVATLTVSFYRVRGDSWVVNQLLTGEAFDLHCHSNLTRAILPYHLTEFDVHDVLNVVCYRYTYAIDL